MKANLTPCIADPAGVIGHVQLIAFNDLDPTAPTLDDKESLVVQHAFHILQSKQIIIGTKRD